MEDTGKQERYVVFGKGRHDARDEFLYWQRAVGDISSLAFAIPAVLRRSDVPHPPPSAPFASGGRQAFFSVARQPECVRM